MDYDKSYQKVVSKIANNIKQLRLKSGITQERMIEYGFNYRHYQKLERGKHSPSLFTLYRLCKIFKVDINKLFD